MSRSERTRDKYPMIDAFGGKHEFLGDGGEFVDTEARIRSIWPFLVGRAQSFQSTLKPRERVNTDIEDTISALYIALVEKDKDWEPARGKYITFAGVVIEREFCSIRDKARTVHSPRNSSGRLKEYKEEEADGTISPRRMKTFHDIRRTAEGMSGIGSGTNNDQESGFEHVPSVDITPDKIAAENETLASYRQAVLSVTANVLNPTEARVIGLLWGLWGKDVETVFRVSWITGMSQEDVQRTKVRACSKIRRHLTEIGHPVAVQEAH